jgi:hypothetical protein
VSVEALGIEKEFLRSLLDEGRNGKAQLPEFQRSWVWPVENIKALLASVSLGYPVGTVMMLRTGGDVRFKQRPIEGAQPSVKAERLILDGQQRLTSLFQALLLGRPLNTQDSRKRKLSGWFYVDMKAALDAAQDREDAFVFVPADKQAKNFRGETVLDLSTAEKEHEALHFPVGCVFDHDEWFDGFDAHWAYDRDKLAVRSQFRKEVLDRFKQYQVPIIELGSSTPRQAVCQVFEKVNTGGVTLTVFELLTATYAADEFDLRKDWEERRKAWSGQEYRVLHEVSNTDFLQAITLLATYDARSTYVRNNPNDDEKAPRIGCRRTDILGLSLNAYQRWAQPLTEGFKHAAKLLHQHYMFDTRFLPYGAQLIPLAATLTLLTGHQANTASAQQKISRWLWCGIFGELYGGTTETRFGRDVPELIAWVCASVDEPRTVQEAQFAPGRLDTLRTRGSAAYKGIYALLMKNEAADWRSGEKASVTGYFDEAIDIHHIFPRTWCEKHEIKPAIYNAIANKTPLTARTNRIISGRAPSTYLPNLARDAGVDLDMIKGYTASHCVDPGYLLADDFYGFMSARKGALLDMIVAAMGKPVGPMLIEELGSEPIETDDDLDDV